MGPITIFAAVVIALFLIVTIAMLSLWQFYKEEYMLGGIVIMWIIVAAFVLVVIFGKNTSKTENPANKPSNDTLTSATFPDLPNF